MATAATTALRIWRGAHAPRTPRTCSNTVGRTGRTELIARTSTNSHPATPASKRGQTAGPTADASNANGTAVPDSTSVDERLEPHETTHEARPEKPRPPPPVGAETRSAAVHAGPFSARGCGQVVRDPG